jgi:HD superfamily phosphodiesterase
MSRFDVLKKKAIELYEAKNPDRETWCDWLYQNHVFIVTDNARDVATRKHASVELSKVAALLHDIADTRMSRFEHEHETQSLRIAKELMQMSGYNAEEMALIVDDALPLHGCRDHKRPRSIEGQVLATADALAHLNTDFYLHAVWAMGGRNMPLDDVKEWALKKLDRDYNDKICFDDIRAETSSHYEALKDLFSR